MVLPPRRDYRVCDQSGPCPKGQVVSAGTREVDQSALGSKRDGLSAIVGAKLAQNRRGVKFLRCAR